VQSDWLRNVESFSQFPSFAPPDILVSVGKEPQPVASTSSLPHQDTQSRQGISPQTQVTPVARAIPPSQIMQSHQTSPISQPPMAAAVDSLVHAQSTYPYPVYAPQLHPTPRVLHPPTAAPPQTWQAANGIAPQQTHMQPPTPMLQRGVPYRDDPSWDNTYNPASSFANPIVGGPGPTNYDYRYTREEQGDQLVSGSSDYYNPTTVCTLLALPRFS
jgi:hypothetical protein